MSGVSVSAAQVDAFYAEALRERTVWTVRDADGFPTPVGDDGRHVHPFWSVRSRVERIVQSVPAYAEMEPVEIDLDKWRTRWLPGLEHDRLLVGLNWSGERASGSDVEPADVERNLAARESWRRARLATATSTTTTRLLIYALALACTSFAVSIVSYVSPAVAAGWVPLAVGSVYCASAAVREASSGSGGQRIAASVTLVGCVVIVLLGAVFVLISIVLAGSGG